MSDGVAVTAGVGQTIATDDAGAAGHVQIVKLARSADGSAVAIQADADGLKVNLGADNDVIVSSSALPAGAATDAVLGAGITALLAALAPHATQATLAAVLAALGSPLQAGGTVALDAATLAALETSPLTDTQLRATAVPVSGSVGHNVTGINDGRKVVTTAGTRAAIASSTPAKSVSITAETDNTGLIVVGGAAVVAALSTRRGTPLYAGDSWSGAVDDLADVFIDSTVSGDGVTFTYLT